MEPARGAKVTVKVKVNYMEVVWISKKRKDRLQNMPSVCVNQVGKQIFSPEKDRRQVIQHFFCPLLFSALLIKLHLHFYIIPYHT